MVRNDHVPLTILPNLTLVQDRLKTGESFRSPSVLLVAVPRFRRQENAGRLGPEMLLDVGRETRHDDDAGAILLKKILHAAAVPAITVSGPILPHPRIARKAAVE